MRRRNVPCSPCGGGSGCNTGCCSLKDKLAILWDRTIGSILKINNVTPDGDGNFEIRAGTNIDVDPVGNGIEVSLKEPIDQDVTMDADLVVNGDIIQNGSTYETHAEQIYTTDDYIIMRNGALAGLPAGDFSGFQVKKYDGTNDGRLVMDRHGIARVGDVGDEQPLMTRDETADMTDALLLRWDEDNEKAITGSGEKFARLLTDTYQISGNAFVSSVTYTDYGYEYTIPWTDLNPQDVDFADPMTAIVTFNPSNDDNTIYAPFCEIDGNGLTIYASAQPTLCGLQYAIIGSMIR